MSAINRFNEYVMKNDNEKTELDLNIEMDLILFKKAILNNEKELFYPGSLRGKENKSEEETNLINEIQESFMFILDDYMNEIDYDKYKDYSDFIYLKKYIHRIFMSFHSEYPLDIVFKDSKDKEKFFKLLDKYLYDNVSRTFRELREKFPIIMSDEDRKDLLEKIRGIKKR